MYRSSRLLWLAAAVLVAATGCNHKQNSAPVTNNTKPAVPSAEQSGASATASAVESTKINGEPVVHLSRQQVGNGAQFLGMTVIPGRGMNVFQITAYVPGQGKVQLLASPPLAKAASLMTGQKWDKYGAASYSFGGAFLIPYPNRIFGQYSAQNHTVTAYWHGQKLVLPANAGQAAMHGLILSSKVQNVEVLQTAGGETLVGTLNARRFGGRWPSVTDLQFHIALTGDAIDVKITATNAGPKPEPMSIGWHPYFRLLSGDRAQARLYVPATERATVNNYKEEKPTGKLVPVKGTPYDFNTPGGRPLGSTPLDDSFTQLQRTNHAVDVRLSDPAAHYGMEVMALSPEIRAVQIYSPPNQKFLAVEPQFNLVDPFGKEWHGQNTGMVTLPASASVTWHVRLHLFTPKGQ